jgi:pre-mRNA cleavage complex 2 protein Pcf11
MSLYHQPTMMTHGQPYRAPPYGHAPPVHEQQRGPTPYQQYAGRYPAPTPVPPLQPMYHMDANSFRDEYMRRLASLTENSRPIIQNLLLFAQEYPRWSDIVGQCIQTHIRSVPPWVKLPAFYVLDCISKNVFDPYAKTFSSFIAPLFLNVYAEVDPTTKRKMEEMLLTWRKGSPDGRELFGVHVQVAIERGIWGAQGSSSSVRTANLLPYTIDYQSLMHRTLQLYTLVKYLASWSIPLATCSEC